MIFIKPTYMIRFDSVCILLWSLVAKISFDIYVLYTVFHNNVLQYILFAAK